MKKGAFCYSVARPLTLTFSPGWEEGIRPDAKEPARWWGELGIRIRITSRRRGGGRTAAFA
jgi:hypothetical protein